MKKIILVALMSMGITYSFAQGYNDYRYPNTPAPQYGGQGGYNNMPAPQYGGGASCPSNYGGGVRIEDLERDINFRIDQGIRTGALTGNEARRVSNAFNQIEMKARYFRANGYMTAYQEQEIRNDLLALQNTIYYESTDGQYRGRGDYGRNYGGGYNYGRNYGDGRHFEHEGYEHRNNRGW